MPVSLHVDLCTSPNVPSPNLPAIGYLLGSLVPEKQWPYAASSSVRVRFLRSLPFDEGVPGRVDGAERWEEEEEGSTSLATEEESGRVGLGVGGAVLVVEGGGGGGGGA